MRMKRKKVWILSGVPGSGKTTWVKEQIAKRGGVHCSRDEVRFAMLKDGEDYFAHENEVWSKWIGQVNKAITNPDVENVYVDATHLNDTARTKVIKALAEGNYQLIVVIFDIPLETCLEQNELRRGDGRAYVPKSVIRRMHASFQTDSEIVPTIIKITKGEKE